MKGEICLPKVQKIGWVTKLPFTSLNLFLNCVCWTSSEIFSQGSMLRKVKHSVYRLFSNHVLSDMAHLGTFILHPSASTVILIVLYEGTLIKVIINSYSTVPNTFSLIYRSLIFPVRTLEINYWGTWISHPCTLALGKSTTISASVDKPEKMIPFIQCYTLM